MGYYTNGGRGDENSQRRDTYYHNKSSGSGSADGDPCLVWAIILGGIFASIVGSVGYTISQLFF